MTALVPEAVEILGGATEEGAAATGAAKPPTRKTAPAKAASAPRAKAAPAPRAKAASAPRAKAAPAPRAKAAPAPRAPATKKSAAAPKSRLDRARAKGSTFKLPGLGSGGGGAHRLVIAEFIVCVVLVGTTPILMRKPADGKLYVPNDFVRLSAIFAVFFVLGLVSQGRSSSRIAAGFGGLVTLGVAYNASGSLAAIGKIFSNAQEAKGDITTAEAGTDTVTMPSYAPIGLTGNPALVGQTLGAGAVAGAQTALGELGPTGVPKSGTPSTAKDTATAAAGGTDAAGGTAPFTGGTEQ